MTSSRVERWRRALRDAGPSTVASLDLFDTLVLRLAPDDAVWRDAADRLYGVLGPLGALGELDAAGILAHRVAFHREREARLRDPSQEYVTETWVRALCAEHGLDPDVVSPIARRCVIAAELDATRLAPDAAELVRVAREQAGRVVVVSDTWHDASALRELLRELSPGIDQVFSSGELLASKRRGTAFVPVEQALGCAAADVVHGGDNAKSDVVFPTIRGWRGVPLAWPRTEVERAGGCTPLRGVFADLSGGASLDDLAGGPFAAMLLCWAALRRAAFEQAGVEHAVYVARDAWLPLAVDRALDQVEGAGPSRSYLRLSRKCVALLHPEQPLHSARGIAGKSGRRTPGAFLGGYDLPDELRGALLATAGLDADAPFDDEAARALSAAVAKHHDAVARWVDDSRAMVREYVGAQLPSDALRLGLVDVGWAGTMQDVLADVLPDATWVGDYLGLTDGGLAPTSRSTKHGWLHDDHAEVAPPSLWLRTAGVIRLWELLLREPAPSIARLRRDETGTVIAVPTDGSDVGPRAAEVARRIEDAVLAAVRDAGAGLPALLHAARTRPEAVRALLGGLATSMAVSPTPAQVRALASLSIEEGSTDDLHVTLGWAGVRHGLAWYPGLLARWRVPGVARAADAVGRMVGSRGGSG